MFSLLLVHLIVQYSCTALAQCDGEAPCNYRFTVLAEILNIPLLRRVVLNGINVRYFNSYICKNVCVIYKNVSWLVEDFLGGNVDLCIHFSIAITKVLRQCSHYVHIAA